MIAYLSGQIIDKKMGSIILKAGGVGYLVTVSNNTISEAEVGVEIEMWTYMAVRENSQDLYGFKDRNELEMFELLLTISGIGTKSAMGIMSVTTAGTLVEGIQSGDATYLAKISGVSKKNAEKIVLGLKDKIGSIEGLVADGQAETGGSSSTTAIDALIALGYSERESRDAIQSLDKSETDDDPEKMIKGALKQLSQ